MFVLFENPFLLTFQKKILIFLIYFPNFTNIGDVMVFPYTNIKANFWAKDT